MAKSEGKSEPDAENENLLCLRLSGLAELQDVKRDLLGVSDGDLQIRNRYFSARVGLTVLDVANIDESPNLIHSCSAIVLAVSEESDLEDGLNWWEAAEKSVNENAVRLLVAPFEMSSEQRLEKLRTWGVDHGIEVVTPAICAEDATCIKDRVRNALDCAKWSHQMQDTDDSGIPAPSDEVHSKLQEANSLRRGLNEDDKQNILSQLMDDAESD